MFHFKGVANLFLDVKMRIMMKIESSEFLAQAEEPMMIEWNLIHVNINFSRNFILMKLTKPFQLLAIETIEKESFVVCDSDNDSSLTWSEVDSCIVSPINIYRNIDTI